MLPAFIERIDLLIYGYSIEIWQSTTPGVVRLAYNMCCNAAEAEQGTLLQYNEMHESHKVIAKQLKTVIMAWAWNLTSRIYKNTKKQAWKSRNMPWRGSFLLNYLCGRYLSERIYAIWSRINVYPYPWDSCSAATSSLFSEWLCA